ncbi:MAG: hypothetical protein ABR903_05225 [Thermodesulfovibrionales bacterium]|jgi:DNA invertase Pin-like site-specific DNA recombinase
MTLRNQKSAKREIVAFTLNSAASSALIRPLLQRLFEVEGQDHCIVLDLKEVNLVNGDAVRFLARCEANGIQL